MKNILTVALISLASMAYAQINNVPEQVTIVKQSGAKFAEGEGRDFSKAKLFISKDTEVNVIKVDSVSTEGGEGDEETFYFYYVFWNDKKGWIKAEDTSYPLYDY